MKLSLPRSARLVRTENAREYYVGKQLRVRLYLHANGKPEWLAQWDGKGRMHGLQRYFHENGRRKYEALYEHGLQVGAQRQWTERGRLLCETHFVEGTGRDVWFGSGSEHPTELREFVRGNLHGREQWWCTTTRVHAERSWFEGKLHGIERQWSGHKLDRGYPRFHIHDLRVTRAAYLRAAVSDPTLVPYRAVDDRPKRTLPLPIHGLAEKRWTR